MRFPVLPLILLLASSAAAAQGGGQQRPQNLKVFPADIPMRALRDTMATFTRALGVRCDYCHVEGEGGGPPRFAVDGKPEKEKAREMIRMTMAINNEYLAKLSDRDKSIVVTCATCHGGVTEPRPLQQIVFGAYTAAGADSAEKTYRNLRQRYYGRAAYDFGEVPLADVANEITRAGKREDAIRFHLLNVEMSPTSAFAHREAGGALLSAGDTARAITMFEKALTIQPNDPQTRRVLDTIKR